MPVRPLSRPLARPLAASFVGSSGSGGGDSSRSNWVQEVVDPGFASAGSWTIAGTGKGASAVVGGVLQVTSTDNAYTVLPATVQAPLDPGVYSVTFTVLTYATGTIGTVFSLTTTLIGGTAGAACTANGTYTENVTLVAGGYIGLAGQGAAIVNSLQVDNMTIQRVA